MLPTDFAIFSSPSSTIPLCIQIRASGVPARGERLRRLVLVVGEDEVDAAAVDLELDAPSSASAIAEHSMCQPGRPRPQGASHAVSSNGFCAFQSAKSSGSSLRRRPRRPRPGPSRRRRGARARRTRAASARGSRRRRRPRRRARARAARAISATISLDHLRRQRLVVGPAEPEPVRVVDVVGGHLARELVRRPPGGPRRVVDLVVDVGDVGDEHRVVALVAQEAREQGEDDVGPRVADVDAASRPSARTRRCRRGRPVARARARARRRVVSCRRTVRTPRDLPRLPAELTARVRADVRAGPCGLGWTPASPLRGRGGVPDPAR